METPQHPPNRHGKRPAATSSTHRPHSNKVSSGFLIRSGDLYLVCHATKGKHFNMERDRFDGAWTISKGMLEPGESEIEGATRELLEETGIDLSDPELSPLKPQTASSTSSDDGSGTSTATTTTTTEPFHRYVTSQGKNVVVYLIDDPKGIIREKYPVGKLHCTSLIEGIKENSHHSFLNGLPEMDAYAWVTAEEALKMVFRTQQPLFKLLRD